VEVKQSKKKRALLNTAQKLFMEHGIRRVTVEEVCSTADASKMTFYRFFKNKDAIAKAVIDEIVNRMRGRMETVMEQEMSFGEKMKAMIHIKEETMNHFSKSFLADLLDDESLAGQHLLKRRAESLGWVREKFLEEQRQGKIRADVNISFVLMMAEYFRVFMKDARLQNLFEDPAELGKTINDFYLYGIIGDHEERT
jgi:AcrR family transcriptional regulator